MELELITNNNKDIYHRLMQLYLYDCNQYFPISLNNEGIFIYDNEKDYIDNKEHIGYIIKKDNKLIGFILLDSINNKNEIQEIFIINSYRKNKIGYEVVKKILDKYKGTWTIKCLPNSEQAESFWTNVISKNIKDYKIEHTGKYNRAEITFKN